MLENLDLLENNVKVVAKNPIIKAAPITKVSI